MSMHVIGTAGHVDHGKSALVRELTGTDPDRLAEEKARGLTIDLGFARLVLPSGKTAGLVDVPGHERFIKNMLAGAGGIDICLFVVAANEGWKPQSAEHLAIVDILGVTAGVVALTKSDTVDDETLEQVRREIADRVGGTSLGEAPIVACSVRTRAGLEELVEALDRAVTEAPEPLDRARPRLWVDRVFTIGGAGTVVTGTLVGGRLEAGDEVEVAPRGLRARVRSIQSHNEEVKEALPGNRVALNLSGLKRDDVTRGDVIVSPGRWTMTDVVDARLVAQPGAESISAKGAHLLYVGSAETSVRLKIVGGGDIDPGTSGYAQIRLSHRLPLARGDRFVLRDAGRRATLGGGEILDPQPGLSRGRDGARLERLRDADGASPEEAFRLLLEREEQLSAREAMSRTGIAHIPGGTARLADVVVSQERLEHLRRTVLEALDEHHRDFPLEAGKSFESVRLLVGLDADATRALIASVPEVKVDGAIVAMEGRGPRLSPAESQVREELLERLAGAAFSPPPTDDVDPALLRALVQSGDLVPVGSFYLTHDLAAQARSLVRARIEADGPQTVAQIRDLLGTTRRYAVPLCEWLDSVGATLRRGDVRMLGPREA